jgi:hypothetical protein
MAPRRRPSTKDRPRTLRFSEAVAQLEERNLDRDSALRVATLAYEWPWDHRVPPLARATLDALHAFLLTSPASDARRAVLQPAVFLQDVPIDNEMEACALAYHSLRQSFGLVGREPGWPTKAGWSCGLFWIPLKGYEAPAAFIPVTKGGPTLKTVMALATRVAVMPPARKPTALDEKRRAQKKKLATEAPGYAALRSRRFEAALKWLGHANCKTDRENLRRTLNRARAVLNDAFRDHLSSADKRPDEGEIDEDRLVNGLLRSARAGEKRRGKREIGEDRLRRELIISALAAEQRPDQGEIDEDRWRKELLVSARSREKRNVLIHLPPVG